jgi:hypothetical protein
MKLLTQGLLARRRIVLVFLLAILVPALVVGYLSLRAFAQRREAVRRVLESHLWVSGESAVQAVEAALLEQERAALRAENFTGMHETGGRSLPHGRLFLLDNEFLIVVPSTGSGKPAMPPSGEPVPTSGFSTSFRRAETLEYSRKDFRGAADAYRESVAYAPTDREKAIALGARARCLVAAGGLAEARRVYDDLRQHYGRILDQAGHFFGLTAALQIHEIDKRLKPEAAGTQALLGVYEGLQDGAWPVSRPEYEFLATEIQTLIEADLRGNEAPELAKAYRALRGRPPPYLDALFLADVLRSDVVPRIKERTAAESTRGASILQAERLLTRPGDRCRFVSYTALPDFDRQGTYYGGVCWSLESLRASLLPQILGGLSAKLGLTVDIVDNSGAAGTSDANSVAESALLLSFREFPLPWKLRVSQPELAQLERAARREDLVYGALFGFIVVLMLLGAVLLARDISRESETTRLRTEFVHNISHELKTPLTLIRLYGETLQRKENLTDEQRRESYEIITKESERLSHLINNVLDFSRIDMGRKEFTSREARCRGPLRRRSTRATITWTRRVSRSARIAPDLRRWSSTEASHGALINL